VCATYVDKICCTCTVGYRAKHFFKGPSSERGRSSWSWCWPGDGWHTFLLRGPQGRGAGAAGRGAGLGTAGRGAGLGAAARVAQLTRRQRRRSTAACRWSDTRRSRRLAAQLHDSQQAPTSRTNAVSGQTGTGLAASCSWRMAPATRTEGRKQKKV
jgi:hypothetical protein